MSELCDSTPVQTLIQLPDECILEILSWLPLDGLLACCTVSKEMYRLSKDPILWRGLILETKAKSEVVPDARLWCSSVVHKDKLYIFGGHITQGVQSNLISSVKNDFFQYDLKDRKWTQVAHQMHGKTEHKCVVYDNSLWFVGGYDGFDYTNSIHKYDIETKATTVVQVSGEPFSRRSALTALVWNDKLYTFGGWNGFSRTWFNDIHEFDFGTLHWRVVETKGPLPKERTSHSAVLYHNKMYIFGGFSGEEYLNDMHEFDFETQTWREITHLQRGDLPSPRSRFCAAVHGENMFIIGGWNKVGYFDDFFNFNFETFVWTKIRNKNFCVPSISQYSLAVNENFMYIFGGFCGNEKQCINRLYLCYLGQTNQAS